MAWRRELRITDTSPSMAGKLSDSIRRNLDKLRKVVQEKPVEAAAPKQHTKPAGQRKEPPAADSPPVPTQSSDAPAAIPKKESPEKKKASSKPWYHHRQRW
jgi:hypothetical protein